MSRIAAGGGAIGCMAVFGLTSIAASQDGDFTPPPGTTVPNYDRVNIGQQEGLEANAFVARTDDAGANWYNPAGLVLREKSALNASANAYEVTTISLEGLEFRRRGTRFSSVGTFFGGVIGAPIIKSPTWRLGFSFTKPVAWTPSRVEGALELDLADVPATLVTTDAAGVPTTTTVGFVPIMEEARAVYNVAIGGNYPLSHTLRVHAGFFTDDSPVSNVTTSIFRKVDLVGASAGVSFGGSNLSGSVGISSSWGTSADRQVGPSLGGVAGVTRVDVRTFNILYAISYAF